MDFSIKGLREIFRPKAEQSKQVKADFTGSGTYTTLFTHSYNGEKNLGELGPIKDYALNYNALRARSWQAYHESEIAQTIINRYLIWVVGVGLKTQSEPIESILKRAKITIDKNEYSTTIEESFAVYSNSKLSDYAGMTNLNMIEWECLKNSLLGGDVLVVNRYEDGIVTTQLIDGQHVQSPTFGTEWWPQELKNGNKIIDGVELDKKGKHVKYYIKQKDNTFITIDARSKVTGLQTAYLVYGLKYRINNVRGVPLFAVVLETLKKLERYKEATVGSAEERQKIVYQVVHGVTSTGENPANNNLAKAFDINAGNNSDIPRDSYGKEMANTVQVTTNKSTFNMPVDSELKSLESKNELYFKDFYSVNFDIVCAAIGIPPNVANSKYDSNFSASRAAIKDWENSLNVLRKTYAFQFRQNVYNNWLEVEILSNRISAPGYLEAKAKGDYMVVEAFRNARFIGSPVPHIDPLKEAMAVRARLGDTATSLPLISLKQGAEALGSGDVNYIMEEYAAELNKSKELGIYVEEGPKTKKGVDVENDMEGEGDQ